MININYILLLLIVAIVIFWIFESISNHSENFNDSDQNKNAVYDTNSEFFVRNPIVPKLKTIPNSGNCPIRENDVQTDYYITKNLLGASPTNCDNNVKTAKEFNKDFFKFRDYTFNNSSMTLDSVDKITNMYLDGNLGEARRHDMKIRDIYDQLTCGPKLYDRQCVRLPYFDNTMHDGYNYSFLNGMHNTRDNWMYKNEKDINGGVMENNLHAFDPEDIQHLPAFNS
jgi:hypothetical protein